MVWSRVWDAGGENTLDARCILSVESIAFVVNGCTRRKKDGEGDRKGGEVRRKRKRITDDSKIWGGGDEQLEGWGGCKLLWSEMTQTKETRWGGQPRKWFGTC